MDENLQRLLGEAARAARLRLGLTQAEVAKKVRLKSGVYGRVERGMMMPSVPTLRRMCETLGISSDVLLSLGAQAHAVTAPAEVPSPGAGEHPELSRIIHILQGWPPERLALLRKLLEAADSNLST
ncbi:helix-turn-helix domain-containing protein [Archangium primigenium]|uniref:helix-turn-helix domain-containing protein n=1 Tax=[Archangium] primigenium TaxID=2792470 RepID=UPI00195A973E|nr:helix-turn-helix transcriptional regulator [Archangium primigenium]MBM7115705.1 helix-turn-helix transcriptional regulator [Archangium primigenium]